MKKPGFTFLAAESAQAGVLRIAGGLIDTALRCARKPGRNPVEDVHVFRTTTKRLRALLQLIRPVISATAFERENARLKKAASRLASSRDRTIAGRTLKALIYSGGLRWRFDVVEGAGSALGNGEDRNAMRQVARDLERSRRGFQRLRINGEGWEAIEPGLMKVYRQARQRMKAALAQPSDQTFHRWRIRVKQLFYQLEWLQPVWPKRFSRMLKLLHELEENLGADHDLVVLCDFVEKAPELSDNAEAIAQVRKCAAKRSRRLRRACEPLGAKVLRETPHRFCRKCERHWRAWEEAGRC